MLQLDLDSIVDHKDLTISCRSQQSRELISINKGISYELFKICLIHELIIIFLFFFTVFNILGVLILALSARGCCFSGRIFLFDFFIVQRIISLSREYLVNINLILAMELIVSCPPLDSLMLRFRKLLSKYQIITATILLCCLLSVKSNKSQESNFYFLNILFTACIIEFGNQIYHFIVLVQVFFTFYLK